MRDLWTNLNKEIPKYFSELAEKFSLKFVTISNVKTALIADRYAIVISVDRFSVNLDYIKRDISGELVVLCCGNYFAEKYDSSDRVNLVSGNGVRETIINNFIVINNGLLNKWVNVLQGSSDWIENFEKSKWYNQRKCVSVEKAAIEKYL